MIILPTRFDGQARYTFEIELDQVTFNFSFEWNDRDLGWYMSIADVDGTPLLDGRRIINDYPLADLYRDPRLPAGSLMAMDTSGNGIEAGFRDLGDRVQLIYIPVAEL